MTTIIITILATLLTALGVKGFLSKLERNREKKPAEIAPRPAPPAPKQTADEVRNDDATDEATAIAAAADEHDVPADVIADGIDWLDSDDDEP